MSIKILKITIVCLYKQAMLFIFRLFSQTILFMPYIDT